MFIVAITVGMMGTTAYLFLSGTYAKDNVEQIIQAQITFWFIYAIT